MPHPDGWALIARIAANKERFGASSTIAATTAFLILRNQMMMGVRSVAELAGVTEAVGREAMTQAIKSLAAYEVRRILENVDAAAAENVSSPEEARRRLAGLAAIKFDGAAAAEKKGPPMRGHKALGARRVRTTSSA